MLQVVFLLGSSYQVNLVYGSEDYNAPVIKLLEVDASPAGKPVINSARVTDNIDIKAVVLSAKTDQGGFAIKAMKSSSDDLYSSVVRTSTNQKTNEYNVEAEDTSGNCIFEGLPSAPLLVKLAPVKLAIKKTGKQAKIDYGESCKKVNFFRRTNSQTQVTNKTKRGDNGKDVPTGSLRNVSISGGKHYIYTNNY